jgi:Excalibur calcium-binding domain
MRHAIAFLAALAFLSGGAATAANGPSVVSVSEQQRRPAWTRNCTALNRKYPHGVGRRRARDKTSDTPVTTFRRSTALYNIAMRWNRGLDRDKDGIACEKK